MNNTIYGIDLTRALPPTLKNDEDMLALARVIGAELQETGRLIRQNIIYPRIDELPENVLDILAYDLHVDWYDFDYPIEAKRGVIKDSVKVHKRLGTVYATLTALRSVYPNSEIEEWFDYGGEPFLFRVVIDVTRAKAPAEYFQIKRAIDAYKRLTAHMESLIYQCRIDIEIAIETRWWWLSAHRTGKALCGTYPQRNTRGALASAVIAAQPEAGGFGFSSTPAGTAPQRSTVAALRTGQIEAHSSAEGFGYTVTPAGPEKAGTAPQRATRAAFGGGWPASQRRNGAGPFAIHASRHKAAARDGRRGRGRGYGHRPGRRRVWLSHASRRDNARAKHARAHTGKRPCRFIGRGRTGIQYAPNGNSPAACRPERPCGGCRRD